MSTQPVMPNGEGRMAAPPAVERRREPRYALSLKGQVLRGRCREPIACIVRNVSKRGARLVSNGSLRKDEAVRLTIFPALKQASSKAIRATFQVVQVRHIGNGLYEAGGRFTQVEGDEADAAEMSAAADAAPDPADVTARSGLLAQGADFGEALAAPK